MNSQRDLQQCVGCGFFFARRNHYCLVCPHHNQKIFFEILGDWRGRSWQRSLRSLEDLWFLMWWNRLVWVAGHWSSQWGRCHCTPGDAWPSEHLLCHHLTVQHWPVTSKPPISCRLTNCRSFTEPRPPTASAHVENAHLIDWIPWCTLQTSRTVRSEWGLNVITELKGWKLEPGWFRFQLTSLPSHPGAILRLHYAQKHLPRVCHVPCYQFQSTIAPTPSLDSLLKHIVGSPYLWKVGSGASPATLNLLLGKYRVRFLRVSGHNFFINLSNITLFDVCVCVCVCTCVCLFFVFLPFLGPLPWHMEVLRLGV